MTVAPPAAANTSPVDFCGAGVLPFTVREDGVVRFLLGRERYITGWRGSCKLSGFGGARKDGESVVATACREFLEESIGVLGDHDARATPLHEALLNGAFAMRVCICDAQRIREHWTYVCQFTWDADVVARFEALRNQLLHIHAMYERLVALEGALPREYPFVREGDVLAREGGAWTVDSVGARVAHGVLRVRMRCHALAKKKWCDFRVARVRDDACERYAEAVGLRAELGRVIEIVAPRVARRVMRYELHATTGALRGALELNEDYLEKMAVCEYTYNELARMVVENREAFRPYFLVALRQVVAQFGGQPAAAESTLHATESFFSSRTAKSDQWSLHHRT